ncbi:radical SAM protein [Breznakiella homolactica]|uniref:Radical SAM protein n=1 Tax=Breznakiella homolactica TaxID=2798577 RepID=A0A7T7XM42_9SPIR|nr:radical SAM protein [Breznakiella homolactica]QQO08737.1 radical SAM protein [Breznakiella homolactica]
MNPMVVRNRPVKTVIVKSKLPVSDYAVNPYVGCPHKCVYCYASFMKRFTGHGEPWGEFLDVKEFPPITDPSRYDGKALFFGSVTDCYNPYEKKYGKTRELLRQFAGTKAEISISTKSALILRDLDILKQIENLTVSFSINTLDEGFRRDMDRASPISERIDAMAVLNKNGIRTVTFISPIFPGITSVPDIARATRDHCGEYWLENLNLRGTYRHTIMQYIEKKHPGLLPLYQGIYQERDKSYWIALSEELEAFARREGLVMKNYFYHELIRKK